MRGLKALSLIGGSKTFWAHSSASSDDVSVKWVEMEREKVPKG